jgi:GxxExxY protein
MQSDNKLENLIYRDECYAIQGAIFDVYREMGCGFLEAVYQECLCRELKSRDIDFISQPELQLRYKNTVLNKKYQPDFVCFGKIIVELKTVKKIAPEHEAQILNYLKASGMKLGLLVNFGAYPKATVKRFVL